MTRRANLHSSELSTWLLLGEPDGTHLTTRIDEGPAAVMDRYVTATMTDDEMITILARMASLPRWAAAIAAITDDATFLDAVHRDTYYMGTSGSRQRVLAAKMREAMQRYDADHEEPS